MNIPSLYISLALGHFFKDNEGIYQYNIAITLVPLFKSVDLFYENDMSDYWIKVNRKPTGFGGRLTVFWNAALLYTPFILAVRALQRLPWSSLSPSINGSWDQPKILDRSKVRPLLDVVQSRFSSEYSGHSRFNEAWGCPKQSIRLPV